jgi:hypothetical protein
MEWFLVIYIYAGAMAQGDSVTLATVPMATRELCEQAGTDLDPLVDGSTKVVRHVCLRSK